MSPRLLDALPETAEQIGRAPHLLLCLDCDDWVRRFGDAAEPVFPSPRARRLLHELSRNPRLAVVVFSARSRADLQQRLDVPGLIYAGNHGLEISGDGFLFIERNAMAVRESLQQLAADLAARLGPIPGAAVEDKGLSLRVEDREVADADREAVRRAVHGALANNSYPFVLTTENGYEIRPRVDWSKADAISWIKEQLGKPDALTIYLSGDAADPPEGTAVRVGLAAAPDGLEGPAEVEEYLAWLAGRLGEVRGSRIED